MVSYRWDEYYALENLFRQLLAFIILQHKGRGLGRKHNLDNINTKNSSRWGEQGSELSWAGETCGVAW